jgi:GntR family transcriptional regulator, transcriptional repressor for pyruvate dehydrogenase complex
MGAPRTEAAIERISAMIASGELAPGARLPREAELAEHLGASRNTLREAVRALVTARVLDVRRGDGTYVTSLRPELLLEAIAFAADLMQPDFSVELVEVRRILEPAATRMAARRIDEATLARLAEILGSMRAAESPDELVRHDADFHGLVASTSGNATLASILAGVSGRTVRARVWRSIVDDVAIAETIAQHEDIYAALSVRDTALAEAVALVHVAATEAWVRRVLEPGDA